VPLSREFDYLPPKEGSVAAPGCRVLVPFGRREQLGVVMSQASNSDIPLGKIRHCSSTLDDSPLLSADDLWLIRFASDYYHHPIGEVVSAALPALLRQARSLYPMSTRVAITDAGAATDSKAMAVRAPRQAELLELLHDAGGNGVETGSLTEQMPAWRRAAKALLEKGFVRRFEAREDEPPSDDLESTEPRHVLNEYQQAALDTIGKSTGFGAFLLDGVTGSGKTEVYLQLAREVLDNQQQVLMLVPEIGLTPQLVSRLRSRLGVEPVVLHSNLTDVGRLRSWRAARAGSAKLVVGTRSAVFTPLPEIGLIVIDEDRTGTFDRLILPERAGGAKPPVFRLVDLSRETTVDGMSEALSQSIEKHLRSSGQALIFLNRRGFAPTLICASCGQIAECDRCDSRMTVHAQDRQLRCHHCGASRPLDDKCSSCGSPVKPLGEGTQRLEEALIRRFPNYCVTRIDSDSTQRKGAIDAALASAEQGDADILVGTQMLSKGHHFPKLSLVGVINADQGLFGSDFRSSERLAQSIVQVAGRAGRETRQGEVIIQTAFPDNPFWQQLIEGGYGRVSDDALAEREVTRWPPFTRLALIRSAAHKQRDAHAFLDIARQKINSLEPGYLRALGPVDAPMARKAGRYHAQLLLQSSDRKELHAILRALRPALESDPAARKVRWSIDVDPVELF